MPPSRTYAAAATTPARKLAAELKLRKFPSFNPDREPGDEFLVGAGSHCLLLPSHCPGLRPVHVFTSSVGWRFSHPARSVHLPSVSGP
jgi:hypothetical protein